MANVRWEVWELSGGTYPAVCYYMPTPGNNEIQIKKQSNISIIGLADGSQAVVSPQTMSKSQPFTFQISEATPVGSTNTAKSLLYIESKINTEIDNKKKVKLVMHTGTEVVGYFLSCTKVYLQSGKEQLYRLEIEFQVV